MNDRESVEKAWVIKENEREPMSYRMENEGNDGYKALEGSCSHIVELFTRLSLC